MTGEPDGFTIEIDAPELVDNVRRIALDCRTSNLDAVANALVLQGLRAWTERAARNN